MAVAYVIQLALNPGPSPVSRSLLVVGTPALTGLLVARLLRVLRGESGRNRRVLETTDDAYAALELDGTVVEWNPAAERMFGLRRGRRSSGGDFGELVYPPEDLPAYRERLRALRDAEEVTGFAFETEYRAPGRHQLPGRRHGLAGGGRRGPGRSWPASPAT